MFKSIICSFKAICVAASLLAAASSTTFAGHIGAHLDAAPPNYNGECPATITFNGWIGLDRPGTVRYRFIRSDRARGQWTTLKFLAGGQQNVSTTWRLGGARLKRYQGWQAIQIIYPEGLVSNHAVFHMSCEK